MTYSLEKLGIEVLTAMQQEVHQRYRRENNLVLLSATGSGKTLAYLLPLIESLDSHIEQVQALVLVPSRELALQTSDVVKSLSSEVRAMACYGGRAAMDEHRVMRELKPHLIIGTPGRILDHIQKENIPTRQISTLVIDEFDKSLELGFQAQMQAILSSLRAVRKRVLLSATDSDALPAFVGGRDFCKLDYLEAEEQMPDRIKLWTLASPEKDKLQTLLKLLCVLGEQNSLIFVNHRESAERVGQFLHENGVTAGIFHGGMEQRHRERTLFTFCNGSCNVLVSTDLASRGLDIPQIDHIIHYHLPLDEQTYIHRNGRTARWDAAGAAWLILGPEETVPSYVMDQPEAYRLPASLPRPSKPKWVTIYISKGKKDKINKVDIVGFLSKVGGLERDQMGRIDVLPRWAYAAVDRRVAESLLARVKGQKIKGTSALFSLAR